MRASAVARVGRRVSIFINARAGGINIYHTRERAVSTFIIRAVDSVRRGLEAY